MDESLNFSFWMASHQGMVRRDNQDAWGKFPENNFNLSDSYGHLFVIADGLGGHLGGKVASALAVKTLGEFFLTGPTLPSTEFFRRAYDAANQIIYERGLVENQHKGMGTTCTALLLQAGCANFAHVGDSRIYLLRHGGFKQLTTDHSLHQELEKHGIHARHQKEQRLRASAITRALGTSPMVDIDIGSDCTLENGDAFVLCTDGLYNEVNEKTIQQVVQSNPPPLACEKLIELANENGGRDNITVGVIKIGFLLSKSRSQAELARRQQTAENSSLFSDLRHEGWRRILSWLKRRKEQHTAI